MCGGFGIPKSRQGFLQDEGMIKIESKFIAESETKVIQHRRLVTPFFYIKLKYFTYEYLLNRPRLAGWPFFFMYKFTGWIDDNGMSIARGKSKKEDIIMDGIDFAVSKFKPSNVVQLRKNIG